MHSPGHCFTRFTADISGYELPEQFTFPFYYTPHPLCVLAAEQLQLHLITQNDFEHDFGLEDKQAGRGKMFGVLLVQNQQGELGYLSAFSGKIADQNLLPGFVPPVYDMLTDEGFFRAETDAINAINAEYKQCADNPELIELKAEIQADRASYQQEEQAQRQIMIDGRANRKLQRKQGEQTLGPDELKTLLDDLGKQSVAEKNALKYLKMAWDEKLAVKEQRLATLKHELSELKERRKTLSNALQHKLHRQYRFLNDLGEERDLVDIFANTTNPVPPAGAGECAAPKLLQYAFKHGFKPLALAEFWWGESPKSEVRQHKKFYPSCNSKCQPILGHMLQGMNVEPNPLAENWAEDKELEILYQDEAMVVVNKPSGLLSVPGKTIKDSAYTRLQAMFPDVEGPFVIHRLDMATSGILVFALTKRANKSLQKQFMARGVQKRYMALLEGELSDAEGDISLPMRGDPEDRPRQLVCFEHGKPAETHWQLIEVKNGRSKVYMYPKTGRTHQLRVHSAHHMGLNMPMVGDGLYGEKANRLHLHAEMLELDHPYSKERMSFHADCEF
ncbi:RluA family pseudouridine synthase [Vibrio natriegens]|uniref:RNA pseudouridine synthase n=1 Tax=Vibrio natriegens NBRC 15636 = ATCC 14048 = DSM 759 TaxID=1219067 RepID=A0AAN0Y6T8_VIBNA|nr:RluA family pseudouridine synthase [Vibrio natriegens]ALR17586.1 pseudouridine synthase [Vibrio natriegens NBRC 15636 = ATCC 14048 = DSM 759]ANQ15076.1 RNA pseudouridine synthase [Vibrio natriegens NBRC 15636 = ATCC 14048 = DSM 759]EPM40071.1 pseudouridine synthase [Vibrio natriegens NBRC 15636 = ATCC 14048 = DSM 759]MDX6029588.1 pseudouridine synthase [Vibrio natriegens NBRC 15636 = ATCC 14048 = DSM 759]UUI13717.1 pseudouridine synthase [Vibrio natriegens]